MTSNLPRVKILILGEGGVGKTSLLSQFIDQEFKPTHMPTIGVEYKQKIIDYLSETPVRVQIWDTAGTERFRTITPVYYKNCDGVLLVFDITDDKSFETISYWISELNENTDVSRVQLLLVGNKSDIEQNRTVTTAKAQQAARSILIDYFETSAKDTEKTKRVFDHIVSKILESKGITVTPKSQVAQNKSSFKLSSGTKSSKPRTDKNCCH